MLEKINEAVAFIRAAYSVQPSVGIILGSGLGNFTGEINIEKEIPYNSIPHFPVSTVEGHSGKLVFGEVGGRKWWPWPAVFIIMRAILPRKRFSR